jgi:hypothetical protein
MIDRLSLAHAGLQLGLTYHQVRSLLLRGELAGGLDENGHYWVDAAAVARQLPRRPRGARSRS